MINYREGAVRLSRLLFQIFFKGLHEDTLGVSGPTILFMAVTCSLFSIQFDLMKFTGDARFNNHGLLPQFIGFIGLLGFIELTNC
jgi:hypothetical protein